MALQRLRGLGWKTLALALCLLAGLWLWQAGKRWWRERGLREMAARLTMRVVSTTPSPSIVVQRLQALSRWETGRMVSQHVVEVQSGLPWLPSSLAGERLLLVAQVETIAGVDMGSLKPEDVRVNGEKVSLTLPPPQILSMRVDEANTRVFARERGWLVLHPDKDLERTARLQALQEARQAVGRSELLPFAQRRAEENVRAFLHALGFSQVEIRWPGEGEPRQP